MTQNIKPSKQLDTVLPTLVNEWLGSPYVAITEGIQVSVRSEFIDSQFSGIGSLYVWMYHVRIDNCSSEAVKLTGRYWKIIDEKGTVQEVSGEGVVGEQPTILPNNSFQYESGVHLRHPSGIMTGHYQMRKSGGELFDVKIPAFSLDVPTVKTVIN